MRLIRLLTALVFFTSTALTAPPVEKAETAPSDKGKTEAGTCEGCIQPTKALLEPIPTEVIETPKPAQCEKKARLFNPKFKSIFEKNDIKVTVAEEEQVMLESALSCLYGLGKGAFFSIKDLLNIIPFLIDSVVKVGKWTYKKVESGVADTSWVQKSTATVSDYVEGAYESTKTKAIETWNKSSTAVKEAYVQGGVGGVASAIAVAAYENSPHHAVKNVLKNFGRMMYGFIGREWDAFQCMSPQGKAETLCSVIGYVVTDIAAAKLIWGNLAKSPKILAAIDITRTKMMRKPVIGKVMMRNYKPVDEVTEKALEKSTWKTDGKLHLEGKSVEVAEYNNKIYARGIDPKSGKLTTYETKGSVKKEIETRIKSNQKISQKAPDAPLSDDFFDPQNPSILRTTEEYVLGVNREISLEISDYHTKKITRFLDQSPENAKEYGEILKTISKYEKSAHLSSPKKLTKDQAATIREIKNLMKEVNGSLAHSKPGEAINLNNIKSVIEDAIITGDRNGLEVYQKALAGLNQVGGPSRFDAFLANTAYNKIINEELKNGVRSCLISKGAR